MSAIGERLNELQDRFNNEPYAKYLGVELVKLTKGCAIMRVKAHEHSLIVGGLAQGGFTASLTDFAGVYAAMSVLESGHTPAQTIEIHFFRPVQAGEEVEAQGTIMNISKRSVHVRVNVLGKGRKLKACATCVFARLDV